MKKTHVNVSNELFSIVCTPKISGGCGPGGHSIEKHSKMFLTKKHTYRVKTIYNWYYHSVRSTAICRLSGCSV